MLKADKMGKGTWHSRTSTVEKKNGYHGCSLASINTIEHMHTHTSITQINICNNYFKEQEC